MSFAIVVLPADVEHFVEILKGKGWQLARNLRDTLGISDRHLRALAAASGGRVLSGNRGYKLTREATHKELTQFLNRNLSQVEATEKRCDLTKVAWAYRH